MSTTDPLRSLKRAAYRHVLEDGTADIVVGFYTVVIAVATQKRLFIALAGVYLMMFAAAWKYLRHAVSSRRIGYAELPQDPPRTLMVATMGAGVLTLLVVAVITMWGGAAWNLEHWPNWTPLLAGAILAGSFLHTATRSGLLRYYAYAALSAGGCLCFWLYPFSAYINPSDRLSLFFFVMAAALLVTGFAVLARFVRIRPVISEEVRGE